MIVNYVKFYKKALDIDFDSSTYEVHHLDFDRTNNSIANLLLLPKKLHRKYHMTKEILAATPCVMTIQSSLTGYSYLEEHIKALRDYADVVDECRKWMDFKDYLLGLCPNHHGIILEVSK